MKVISPIHGEIEYNEQDIIEFGKPIPGFDNLSKFIIKDIDDQSIFKLLQSTEDKNIGFVIVSPFISEEDYEIKLTDNIIKELDIEGPNDVALFSIVTVNSKVENITANLRAPLVINIRNKKGQQFIVQNDKYKIKHPIVKG